MEPEIALNSDIMPWLKADILGEFGDLLDEQPGDAVFRKEQAATLGSADLMETPSPMSGPSASFDEGVQAEWLRSFLGGAMAAQSSQQDQPIASTQLPFPGFPAAGVLTSVPTSSSLGSFSSPLSCSRCPDESMMVPNSWESSLSNYSLEDSLAELSSIPESRVPCKLKSEDSFVCTSLDSLPSTMSQDRAKDELPQTGKKSKAATKSETSPSAKASLADRNRERQQRFRQRQKAKIETLETQVKKLSCTTSELVQQKVELVSRNAGLVEALQSKEKIVAALTAQVSQMKLGGSESGAGTGAELTLTYCAPPLCLTHRQLQQMNAVEIARLWREYVWLLNKHMKEAQFQANQWTPETERLDGLTSELVQLMMHLWNHCPDFDSLKASGSLDNSHCRDESEDDNWQRIAQQLTLTPDQLASLTTLRNSMKAKLQVIWATRREANASLVGCYDDHTVKSRDLASQHVKVSPAPPGLESLLTLQKDFKAGRVSPTSFARIVTDTEVQLPPQPHWLHAIELHSIRRLDSLNTATPYLRVKQIMDILNKGVQEEDLLARDFEFAFLKKVLRPNQCALCIVQAYPRFPDSQALANWLAACHGDEEAQNLMTNYTTSSSTSFHSNS